MEAFQNAQSARSTPTASVI